MKLHHKLLERYFEIGQLTLIEPDGTSHRYGSGEGGRQASWIINTADCMGRILRNPSLNLGETYMDEAWDVTGGSLADLIFLLRRNLEPGIARRVKRPWLGTLLRNWNHIAASRRNASHHYDLDEPLFRSFLDREMHYSCAYLRDPGMSLEAAQAAKAEHIARKLLLEPGQRVLDIGSGWGAMALYLAEHADVEVVGLTLSQEQLRTARAGAERRGLAGRVAFLLEDYREHQRRYDRIVSIGMFEHVGRRNYRRFFDRLRELLTPQGVALIHSIGSHGPPVPPNPWLQRHIFPGGYIPSLSDVAPRIERAGLTLTDLEVLRYHYAWTLEEWHRRFQQHRSEFVELKGERFCRMWEFYLSASQAAFELGNLGNFQLQLAMPDARVPITRDYLHDRLNDGRRDALAGPPTTLDSNGRGETRFDSGLNPE